MSYTLKNKIPAFTLMEAAVAMVITGVIVMLVFGGINFFNKRVFDDMKYQQAITEWFVFRSQVLLDVSSSKKIEPLDNGLEMIGDFGTIRYFIEDKKLVIWRNEKRIVTNYEGVVFEWKSTEENENYDQLCVLNVPVYEELMQLEIMTYQDYSSRMNQWINEFQHGEG